MQLREQPEQSRKRSYEKEYVLRPGAVGRRATDYVYIGPWYALDPEGLLLPFGWVRRLCGLLPLLQMGLLLGAGMQAAEIDARAWVLWPYVLALLAAGASAAGGLTVWGIRENRFTRRAQEKGFQRLRFFEGCLAVCGLLAAVGDGLLFRASDGAEWDTPAGNVAFILCCVAAALQAGAVALFLYRHGPVLIEEGTEEPDTAPETPETGEEAR